MKAQERLVAPEAVVYEALVRALREIRAEGDEVTAESLAAALGLSLDGYPVSLRYRDRQLRALAIWHGGTAPDELDLPKWKTWAQEVLTKRLIRYAASRVELLLDKLIESSDDTASVSQVTDLA